MKASELREKSAEELNSELLSLREEQFRLRMQVSTGQLRADTSSEKYSERSLLELRLCSLKRRVNNDDRSRESHQSGNREGCQQQDGQDCHRYGGAS